MTTRVILATTNEGKRREFAPLLAPLGLEVVSQSALGIVSVEETGSTFEENALLKARHAARQAGGAALADDSGLEVEALNGGPGVYSARYAGVGATDDANNQRLLEALAGVTPAHRGARYRCVLAFVRSADDPAPLIAEGRWRGHIALTAAGSGGFGYDVLFVPDGYEETVAQLPAELKQQHSHRAQAVARLLAQLHREAV